MNNHNPAKYTPYHEMIARRAHDIWEGKGRPDGRDVEHWLQAERELEAESRGQPEQKKAAPAQPKRGTR